jgi:hypothetical protein
LVRGSPLSFVVNTPERAGCAPNGFAPLLNVHFAHFPSHGHGSGFCVSHTALLVNAVSKRAGTLLVTEVHPSLTTVVLGVGRAERMLKVLRVYQLDAVHAPVGVLGHDVGSGDAFADILPERKTVTSDRPASCLLGTDCTLRNFLR